MANLGFFGGVFTTACQAQEDPLLAVVVPAGQGSKFGIFKAAQFGTDLANDYCKRGYEGEHATTMILQR